VNLAHITITNARLGSGIFSSGGDDCWAMPVDPDVLVDECGSASEYVLRLCREVETMSSSVTAQVTELNRSARKLLAYLHECHLKVKGQLFKVVPGPETLLATDLDQATYMQAARRLIERGLAEWMGSGGGIKVTSAGLKTAEDTDQLAFELPIADSAPPAVRYDSEGEHMPEQRSTETRLFVSHSSVDKSLATAFVELVDGVLTVPENWIRCTSVHGYTLEPGADGPKELRANLKDACVVVGLITPSSATSAYVLMELGAGWGLGSWVIPLIGGIDFQSIPGPIGQGIHAAKVTSEEGVASVLDSIVKRCAMTWRGDQASRTTRIKKFVTLAQNYVDSLASPALRADA
jgi:hypothetical protein